MVDLQFSCSHHSRLMCRNAPNSTNRRLGKANKEQIFQRQQNFTLISKVPFLFKVKKKCPASVFWKWDPCRNGELYGEEPCLAAVHTMEINQEENSNYNCKVGEEFRRNVRNKAMMVHLYSRKFFRFLVAYQQFHNKKVSKRGQNSGGMTQVMSSQVHLLVTVTKEKESLRRTYKVPTR